MTAQIPDFIALAEIRLSRDLRIAPLIAGANLVIAASGTGAALPADCVEVVSARLTNGNELSYVTPDTYNRTLINANGVVTPLYYTIMGGTFYTAPAWGQGGTVAINYFRKEKALSGTNATNWYITNAPDMLLYGCLLEGAPYIKDTVNAQMWEKYYENAKARLNDQYGVLDSYQRMMQLNQGPAKALAPSF